MLTGGTPGWLGDALITGLTSNVAVMKRCVPTVRTGFSPARAHLGRLTDFRRAP